LIPDYKSGGENEKVVECKPDWVYKVCEQADDFAGFLVEVERANFASLLFSTDR
jgi:hypothetical protein